MSDGFRNDIVGGVQLRIPSIQSPNYVTGVSGWAIFRDGTVEFNTGTFRSNLISGPITGAHVSIGNVLPAALMNAYIATGLFTSISSYSILEYNSATDYKYNIVGIETGGIDAFASGYVSGADIIELYREEVTPGVGINVIFGSNSFNTADYAVRYIFRNNPAPTHGGVNRLNIEETNVTIGVGNTDIGSLTSWVPVTFNDDSINYRGTEIPKGIVLEEPIQSTISSGPSATEQIMYTTAQTYTFRAGHAFEVELSGLISSAAVQRCRFKIHEGNGIAAGNTLLMSPASINIDTANTDLPVFHKQIFVNATAADIITGLTVSFTPSVATAVRWDGVGSATPAFIIVKDIGSDASVTAITMT